MHGFLVLGLAFSIPGRDWLGETCLRNDLFCVERNVKPQLNQPINQQVAHMTRLILLHVEGHLRATADRLACVLAHRETAASCRLPHILLIVVVLTLHLVTTHV